MGYAHINNLYKDTRMLMFKHCYFMEKVHGTSANLRWTGTKIQLFSGGASGPAFEKLFDLPTLAAKFFELFNETPVCVYGEAYGGREQGMSLTYGKELKFIVFDVQIGESWLDVPSADDVAQKLGLEFVPYMLIDATVDKMNEARDLPSQVAMRRGCANTTDKYGFCPPISEGAVFRPMYKVYGESGERLVCKHKRDEFKERGKTPDVSEEKLKVLADAEAIATEWVVPMRLTHVLDKLGNPNDYSAIPSIIEAMLEDVFREAAGEVVDSKEARKAIGTKTVSLYKKLIQEKLQSLA